MFVTSEQFHLFSHSKVILAQLVHHNVVSAGDVIHGLAEDFLVDSFLFFFEDQDVTASFVSGKRFPLRAFEHFEAKPD